MRRNKLSTAVSIVTAAIALFCLALSFLATLNLQYMYKVVEREFEIQAYFRKDANQEQVDAAINQAKSIEGVVQVKYVSKADALEELKSWFGDKAPVLNELGNENPLPASIRVKTDDASKIPLVAEKLKSLNGIEEVVYQEEATKKLAALGRVVQTVSLGGVLLVGIVAMTVIGNSIRLTIDAKKNEIAIMKLVGATDSFITLPFILQGVLMGTSGGFLATFLAAGFYLWLVGRVGSLVPFFPLLGLSFGNALDMLFITLVAGAVFGLTGSAISMRKYLDV